MTFTDRPKLAKVLAGFMAAADGEDLDDVLDAMVLMDVMVKRQVEMQRPAAASKV